MLTLTSLILLTPKDRLLNVSRYTLQGYKLHEIPNGTHIQGSVKGLHGVYRTDIKLFGDFAITSPVHVQCTCKHFVHQLEVALAARGSSSLSLSSGEYPKQTNPKLTPHLCSHLLYMSKVIAGLIKERKEKEVTAPKASEKLTSLTKKN